MIVRKQQFQRAIEEAIPWYCTSCGACTLRCPRDVKPSEVIIDVRSALVEDGQVPASLQKALENTAVQKNPWGRSRGKRGAWAEKLDIEIPHVSETESKRLLFVCCIQAYDPRCMVIPANVARILNKGGYEFGILGEEEACCGNEIRRIGEAGLFEELVEENTAIFQEYGVKEIIALSPHCMNTLEERVRQSRHQGLSLLGSRGGHDHGRGDQARPRRTRRRSSTTTPVSSENRTTSSTSREAYSTAIDGLAAPGVLAV